MSNIKKFILDGKFLNTQYLIGSPRGICIMVGYIDGLNSVCRFFLLKGHECAPMGLTVLI